MLEVHGTALIDLLAAADHALYQAKGAGRNRVTFAPDLPAPELRSAPLLRRVPDQERDLTRLLGGPSSQSHSSSDAPPHERAGRLDGWC